MCGISGIYHPGERSEPWRGPLHAMTTAMVHRGPDEEGFFSAPGISLGMRRLSVIDLTGGSQPIANEDNSLQIVCNGEIYRYEALREELLKKGHRFKTQSDVEVILHLYEEYGLDCFEHFDGMFAFALWDARQERLIVARDRFGIKPLFYTRPQPEGHFAFASELRPLLHMPGVSKALDPTAIDQFFTLSYILHPHSIYQDVRKLSPGSYLLAEHGSVKEIQYWNLPAYQPPYSMEEASTVLDAAIASAVQAMMRSDVPVGAFLSGGLDSSTVVYHMARLTRRPVQTFSVRFAEKTFDEGGKAKLIAKSLGTEHHEIFAQPEDVKRLPIMADHFGEPFADPSQIPTYLVSKLAREQVTVALSGDGGDEILGGYETYSASLLADKVGRLPKPILRTLLKIAEGMPVSLEQHLSTDYKIKKFLKACHLPPLERHAGWRTIFHADMKRSLYSREFTHQLGAALDRPVFEQWASIFSKNGHDTLTLYQMLDMKTYLVDNNLTKVDRMSMAHSLEVRIPLLDLGVAQAALRIPAAGRARGLKTKILLRKLMRGRLPADILAQPKRGFAVPLGLWFINPLAPFVAEQLNPERVRRTGFLQAEPIQDMIRRHHSRKANFSRQIWNLICFVNWHENSRARGLL